MDLTLSQVLFGNRMKHDSSRDLVEEKIWNMLFDIAFRGKGMADRFGELMCEVRPLLNEVAPLCYDPVKLPAKSRHLTPQLSEMQVVS